MGYKIILGIFIFSMFLIGAVYYFYPQEEQQPLTPEEKVIEYNEDRQITDIPIDMIVDIQELGDCDGPIKCDRTGCNRQC